MTYGARYMDPGTSRWISVDPAGFELANPMEKDKEGKLKPKGSYSVTEAVNWYSYCGNNPVIYVDPSGMDMTTSDEGIEFIKKYESFQSKIYDAGDGEKTIGYGHVLTKEEIDVGTYDNGITEKEATELLKKDLKWFEDGINRNFEGAELGGRDLTQNEFDALVALSFNTGRSDLMKSDLFQIVQKNKDFTAADIKKAIINNWKQKKWISVKGEQWDGLIKRRNDELELFFKSDYKVDRKLKLNL